MVTSTLNPILLLALTKRAAVAYRELCKQSFSDCRKRKTSVALVSYYFTCVGAVSITVKSVQIHILSFLAVYDPNYVSHGKCHYRSSHFNLTCPRVCALFLGNASTTGYPSSYDREATPTVHVFRGYTYCIRTYSN